MENNLKKIVGPWELLDSYMEEENSFAKWDGEEGGILVYTIEGFMSVAINRSSKKNLSDSDKKRLAFFYAGSYEIVDSTVIHYIKYSNIESLVGKRLVRSFEFKQEKLILRGAGLDKNIVLTWQREV